MPTFLTGFLKKYANYSVEMGLKHSERKYIPNNVYLYTYCAIFTFLIIKHFHPTHFGLNKLNNMQD